jgi:hypothetical protein
MISSYNTTYFPKWSSNLLCLLLFLFLSSGVLLAQEDPPRPIVVTVTPQTLSFGAFYHGGIGGTVAISPLGARSATGDVVLLNLGFSFSTALYEIVGNPGTVITLLNGPDVPLSGSNGGSMTLQIGQSNPLSPFVLTNPYPMPTQINVGGTLTVGNSLANPPGSYSGTFDITFNQQ